VRWGTSLHIECPRKYTVARTTEATHRPQGGLSGSPARDATGGDCAMAVEGSGDERRDIPLRWAARDAAVERLSGMGVHGGGAMRRGCPAMAGGDCGEDKARELSKSA
jgi:hypothetical protein